MMTARILVIDADQAISDVCRLLLESEGYDVQTARREHEDLAMVKVLQPDLILLDITVYGLQEGFFLLHRLCTHPSTKDIPVIVYTAAQAHVFEQEDLLRKHEIPIVHKPFDIDDLLQVVRQTLPSSI